MIPLSALLADHQEFHSDLQMDAFITIRAGGTLYGCYKQALRELARRCHGLREIYTQRALMEIDIEELESTSTDDTYLARRTAVRLAEKRIALRESGRILRDTEREFLRFYGQAAAIREALSAEGIKFPLDSDTRNRLDREMWEHRIKCMIATDLQTHGRPATAVMELLQAAPLDMRARITGAIGPELIDWFMGFDPAVPNPISIGAIELRKLVGCE